MKKLLTALFGLSAAMVLHSSQPIVIAHRGASGYLPEHTLPAKALAHAMGADYIEQDIVLSKDGVPIVLHDIEIDTVTDVARRFPDRRRANGRFYAIDFTLAEIKQLQVTERFDPKTGKAVYPKRFPLWRSEFRISTLEEVLELISGLNHSTGRKVGVYPEIKSPRWHRQEGQDITAIVLEVLARHGYSSKEDAFFLQCFDFAEIKRLRTELGFRGKLVQLIGRYGGGEVDAQGKSKVKDNTDLLSREALSVVAQFADGVGLSYTQVVVKAADGSASLNELPALARELGLLVHLYTFRADALPDYADSADDLLAILFHSKAIDGIFTDQPDVVVRFLDNQGPAKASTPESK